MDIVQENPEVEIKAFLRDYLAEHLNGPETFLIYKKWCESKNESPKHHTVFFKAILEIMGVIEK